MSFKNFVNSRFLYYTTVILAIVFLLMFCTAFHIVGHLYFFYGLIVVTVIYFVFGLYQPRYYYFSGFYLFMLVVVSLFRI